MDAAALREARQRAAVAVRDYQRVMSDPVSSVQDIERAAKAAHFATGAVWDAAYRLAHLGETP